MGPIIAITEGDAYMLSTLKVSDAKREEGFTLIELLVVVIIIGILAAIAIPTFLSQRERGFQAELTSGVRNLALEIEAEAVTANGVYPTAEPVLAGINDAGSPLTMNYTKVSDTAFILCGTTSKITTDNNVTYDTVQGGIQGFEKVAC